MKSRRRVNSAVGFLFITMRILATALFILMILTVATAQTRVDRCHVFVVDVKKAGKAINGFRETGNAGIDAKAVSIGQKMFPEFRPLIGEEELTTKTYRFPRSNLIITASVFYTDESMASSQTNDSMLLGIVVSRRAHGDATVGPGAVFTDVTYNDGTDTVRVHKNMMVNGRLYIVGLECHCKEKPRSE
jgi:hypothetical protein